LEKRRLGSGDKRSMKDRPAEELWGEEVKWGGGEIDPSRLDETGHGGEEFRGSCSYWI